MRACSYLRSGGGLSVRIVVRDHLGAHLELGPVEARVEVGGAGIAIEHLGRHLAVRRVLAGLEAAAPGSRSLADRRLASTDPAEPPPTMMKS